LRERCGFISKHRKTKVFYPKPEITEIQNVSWFMIDLTAGSHHRGTAYNSLDLLTLAHKVD
jgi:hypothetical protein